jgi:hypothetical protein
VLEIDVRVGVDTFSPVPNYSRFRLDPSGLLRFRHKRSSSISTDCTRRLPAQRSLG